MALDGVSQNAFTLLVLLIFGLFIYFKVSKKSFKDLIGVMKNAK